LTHASTAFGVFGKRDCGEEEHRDTTLIDMAGKICCQFAFFRCSISEVGPLISFRAVTMSIEALSGAG